MAQGKCASVLNLKVDFGSLLVKFLAAKSKDYRVNKSVSISQNIHVLNKTCGIAHLKCCSYGARNEEIEVLS